MEKFKGTKGKWESVTTNWDYQKSIFIEGTEIHIADLDIKKTGYDEEVEANALLISKAPEMLEALQQVIKLKDLIEYDESIVNESNIGEASAISQMLNRIQTIIKEATEI